MRPRHVQGLALATGIIAGVMACNNQPALKGTSTAGRPECPGADSLYLTVIDSVVKVRGQEVTFSHTVTQIPIAGDNSNVPEFHDCQRFVVKDAKDSLQYDSLYAIFASSRMQELADSLNDSLPYSVKTRGFPTAEILSYGGQYATLGIEPNFNCLYLYRDGPRWKAKMVPIGSDEKNCGAPLVDPAAATGTDLDVRLASHSGWSYGDYPDVARWDWDSVNLKHYVGIKCGPGWCEVGASGFVPSFPHTKSPSLATVPGPAVTSAERARVFQIKGWYDRQRLAVRDANGNLKPGRVWGTIIPHPVLGRADHNTANYFQPWIHVATADVSADYRTKIVDFKQGENRIWLCSGTAIACGVPASVAVCKTVTGLLWWTKMQHVGAGGVPDGEPHYRCAIMRPHPNLAIPGTSRWRWSEVDETSWMRCTQGCCELH